jgi:hypothetical protein
LFSIQIQMTCSTFTPDDATPHGRAASGRPGVGVEAVVPPEEATGGADDDASAGGGADGTAVETPEEPADGVVVRLAGCDEQAADNNPTALRIATAKTGCARWRILRITDPA